MEIHKVFISYHHADDIAVKEFVDKYSNTYKVFTPKIVGEQYGTEIESDDAEYTMRKIRENYLTDSTVTIVLIGKETYKRKYVDWEIASTLRNDPNNKRSGLIGIFLPGCNKFNTMIPERLLDNIRSGYAECYDSNNCSWITLERWIEDAYHKRNDSNYKVDNGRKLYKNNRP